ncbi:MAG: hypothetical protein K0U98_24200 [Deltaproteobacteria bacterium]|nr:hypothetical protein [Deltaproteobacteria bacterium]
MPRTQSYLVGALVALCSWVVAFPTAAYPNQSPNPEISERNTSRTGSLGCLPTCSSSDGRFLALSSGDPLRSLSSQVLTLVIVAQPGLTSFEVSIFDGDSGSVDTSGESHWDRLPGQFRYTVMADTDRDGVGDVLALPAVDADTMPDNDWFSMDVPRMPEARGPGGNYFYVLHIENTDPSLTVLNSFKVRTNEFVAIPGGQPFGLFPSITSLADGAIIYPNFPDSAPTTYDGSFHLFFDVPVKPTELVVWDGDFDYGSVDGSVSDTDDPSTPNAPFVPSWDSGFARPEGIAVGDSGATGSPADNGDAEGAGRYLVRSPNPSYLLRTPRGTSFTNKNPSGHQEWEQFRIRGRGGDPSPSDDSSRALTAGMYSMEVSGLDLQNSIFLKLDHPIICVGPTGLPCSVPGEAVLGETGLQE